jgi:hypothetical protein
MVVDGPLSQVMTGRFGATAAVLSAPTFEISISVQIRLR